MKTRQKDKRVKEENRVHIETPGEDCIDVFTTNALTQDLSLNGAQMITAQLYEVGSYLNMTLFLTRSKKVVRVRALVRWAQEVDAGIYEMGVQFEYGIPASITTLLSHLYRKDNSCPPQGER